MRRQALTALFALPLLLSAALPLARTEPLPTRVAPAVAPAVPRAAPADPLTAVRRIEGWAVPSPKKRAKIAPEDVSAAIDQAFTEGAVDERMDWPRFDGALCALAGVTFPSAQPNDLALRRLAVDALRARLADRGAGGTSKFLYESILPLDAEGTEDQRVGALLALQGQHPELAAAQLRELSMSDRSSVRVREAASTALVGYRDPLTGRALLAAAELAKDADARRIRDLLRDHLIAIEGPGFDAAWPADLGPRLAGIVASDVASTDWRIASRALPLVRFVPVEDAAPRLIEALGAWLEREAAAEEAIDLVGSRRLILEITSVLQQLSGRQIGPKLNSWRTWWKNRGDGPIEADDDPDATTVSAFFGLEIESGAVAFLIDASGSMKAPPPREPGASLAPGNNENRYDEAVEQLMNALAANVDPIGFRLALFSTGAKVWKDHLTLANDKGRRDARRWLERYGPGGNTELGAGMEALFPTTSSGDLRELPELDTVMILCDGETLEDADWARNWIERHNREAELVFHCLQIGGGRAEALETLANLSGGTFVRLGGGR